MPGTIPLVDYLVLDDGDPHLVSNTCDGCGAHYFDRRNACAHCGGTSFTRTPLARTGVVASFTIVYRAAPGVPAPFVSAKIDLDGGGSVLANVVGVEPDPEHVVLGMPVTLTTYPVGTDDEGVEAIGFGFAPQD